MQTHKGFGFTSEIWTCGLAHDKQEPITHVITACKRGLCNFLDWVIPCRSGKSAECTSQANSSLNLKCLKSRPVERASPEMRKVCLMGLLTAMQAKYPCRFMCVLM